MSQVIYRDFNVYDEAVSDSKEVTLEDAKVVIQSLWRLLTTQEGEIPNYREYGLDIKSLTQLPYSTGTINNIYSYVEGKVKRFESGAEIIKADVDGSVDTGEIYMTFYAKVKATGDIIKLPIWEIQLAGY